VLNFTDNAGDAVALLAHGGRAVVADTAAGQVNATDFTEFFLQAIESGAPANGVKNDAVPLLTAFNWATVHNAQWIVRQRHDEAGWTVEGKESAELFKKLYPMASGDHSEYAGQFVDSPKSQIQPDPIIDVVPDPAHYDAWGGRRMITETPTLDDLGDGKGAAGISEKGFHPLAGALPTDQGFLARRIILGQPQLLPAPPVKDQ